MKTLQLRFVFALILTVTGSLAGLLNQSQAECELAKLTQPIEAAAQTVIDSTEAVRDFGSYLPGSFK